MGQRVTEEVCGGE
jgi:hypothetical protein